MMKLAHLFIGLAIVNVLFYGVGLIMPFVGIELSPQAFDLLKLAEEGVADLTQSVQVMVISGLGAYGLGRSFEKTQKMKLGAKK